MSSSNIDLKKDIDPSIGVISDVWEADLQWLKDDAHDEYTRQALSRAYELGRQNLLPVNPLVKEHPADTLAGITDVTDLLTRLDFQEDLDTREVSSGLTSVLEMIMDAARHESERAANSYKPSLKEVIHE